MRTENASSLSQVIDDQETAKLEYNQFLVLTDRQMLGREYHEFPR